MNPPPQVKYTQVGIPLVIGLVFSFCILFLQVGITYYQSFQTLALVILLFVIFKNRPSIVNLAPIFLCIALFIGFLSLTTIIVPLAVSENSENIFITFIGVVGYATMIIIAPNIAFRSPGNILYFFRFVSSATLIAIASLIFITDLSIIPFLTRETLILQNTTLITNYATLEVLLMNFDYLEKNGLSADLDLFYGEQSFLSVVIFSCITSQLICNSLLRIMSPTNHGRLRDTNQKKSFSLANYNLQGIVITVGIASMVYIQSFSSFFYALVICASLFFFTKHRRIDLKPTLGKLLVISLVIILLGYVVWSAFDYYVHRLTTVSDSISFKQRFSIIFDFGILYYIKGVGNAANLPQYGFQNGILYIIGISGLGGICMLTFLFYRTYSLARPLRLSFLAAMCVLGIFSQNGGILSPNKVVLLSLVLIPMSCVNRFRLPKRTMEGRTTLAKV